MLLLNDSGMRETSVTVKDRLWETGRTGAEIDRTVIVIRQRDVRTGAAVIACDEAVIFCKRRALFAYENEGAVLVKCRFDILDTGDELRTEKEDIQFCKIRAVQDLIGCVTEIERHCEGTGL